MVKRYYVFLLVLFGMRAFAQQPDTIHLQEVAVYGMPVSQFAAGTKVVQVQSGGESDLLYKTLSDQTAAYFKNYGNSQLSTIAFRGTSASHTAVLWNGVNISSPTLGQTDFALLPSFLLEDIAVQFGTSSSLYGSDALGGSVLLAQRKAKFDGKTLLQLSTQYGSFRKKFGGLKALFGTRNIEFRSKAFVSDIKNDFPYLAPQVGSRKRQNDAAVRNFGFDQQIHVKLNDHQRISWEGMYTNNFRHIQPTVTHDTPAGTLLDRNGRMAVNYSHDLRAGTLFATAAYIHNNEVYGDTSSISTGQLNLLVNFDRTLTPRINLRYGVSAAEYSAISSNFDGRVSEHRYDAFISYKQLIASRLTLTGNLRQSVYAGRRVPFTPSLGVEYVMARTTRDKVIVRGQSSRGYRIPTLNDRYWIPGGNPDLRPEDALHAEGGSAWVHTAGKSSLKIEATSFHTWVTQWILWQPGNNGIWAPTNLQKVYARGVETGINYVLSGSRMEWQAGGNYAYTRSENRKGLNEFDTSVIGKQLPFVPLHNANVFIKTSYRSWWTQFRVNYTSRRFIALDNDEGQSLPSYALVDVNFGHDVVLGTTLFRCRAEINNLLDTYYEMNKSYAMPGRNYSITLTVNLNNKPTQ